MRDERLRQRFYSLPVTIVSGGLTAVGVSISAPASAWRISPSHRQSAFQVREVICVCIRRYINGGSALIDAFSLPHVSWINWGFRRSGSGSDGSSNSGSDSSCNSSGIGGVIRLQTWASVLRAAVDCNDTSFPIFRLVALQRIGGGSTTDREPIGADRWQNGVSKNISKH